MNSEQRTWIEHHTEREAIIFQDDDIEDGKNIMRGMFWCSLCGWKLETMQKLVPALQEYGTPEYIIDEIRTAWGTWKND